MNFLKSWNRFFFERNISLYELMGLAIVANLAEISAWYFLLLIPLIVSSHILERIFVNE